MSRILARHYVGVGTWNNRRRRAKSAVCGWGHIKEGKDVGPRGQCLICKKARRQVRRAALKSDHETK